MKLKTKTVQLISEWDWSTLVQGVYGKPYNLQQQQGCMRRGESLLLSVPETDEALLDLEEDLPNDIPTWDEDEYCSDYGVKFAAWLGRTPKVGLTEQLWWERNFYPPLESVANDLHAKGLLPAGEYLIRIDW